jgi:hypothetical protein
LGWVVIWLLQIGDGGIICGLVAAFGVLVNTIFNFAFFSDHDGNLESANCDFTELLWWRHGGGGGAKRKRRQTQCSVFFLI